MEEKKHIDRLYQEKFKDFEATPREAVWNNISSRLQEKERKRRSALPLWYRIAGVAAVLALLFNYASGLFRTTPAFEQAPVTSTQEREFGELRLVSNSYNENMIRSSIILQAIMQDTKNKEVNESRRLLGSATGKSNNGSPASITNYPVAGITGPGTAGVTRSSGIISPAVTRIEIANAEESNTDKTNTLPRKDIFEEISLAEEDSKLENSPVKKLRITTTAAPVYFENMGSGNAIDARFANNQSEGEVSMSYGINLAYQISDKIKIRSGISKVDLSHNTKGIAFTATVNPIALSGIDYRGGELPKYRIENTASRPFGNTYASSEFNRSSLAAPATGYLNQRLGFIEVPLEIEYVIIDKKIGLNIIGGGSTLFLDENMISLNSANFSTDLGQANNLNNVSFSTNIGVGLDYKISPQFQLNLEPILKYQINTYNNSTNLSPYFFGVYSGFSFKF
jgi:hypothetical protein